MAKIKISFGIIAVLFAATSSAIDVRPWADPLRPQVWEYRVYQTEAVAKHLEWRTVPASGLKIAREYQGFIEYRTHLPVPYNSDGSELGVYLGRIGDVDQAYVNDILIGETGSFPPIYENNMDIVREYRIPKESLSHKGNDTLRVVSYVEYPAVKGLDLGAVLVGKHRDLQREKYFADLFWYASRMFVPILCLVLAAVSLPSFSPQNLRLQQTIILMLGLTCFVFGVCRSRAIFHFTDVLTAYKLTGYSSVLAVVLIYWYGLVQARIRQERTLIIGLLFGALPLVYFWLSFSIAPTVIATAAVMKQWFFVEFAVVWISALLVALRAGPGRNSLKLGFLFLALVVTNDVLRDLRILKLPVLMDIGFGAFLVALIISQLISLRLSWIGFAQREAKLEHDARIGKISSLLSHDLRNKIGAVSVLVDSTALAPDAKDKIASLLGRIKESVELHLKQAIGTVIEAESCPTMNNGSKIEDGPACSIGGALQTCIEDLKTTHSREVIADIPRKTFTAFAPLEFSEMSRCATNVLINAIEASATGPSKIYVSVHVSDTSCEIVVKDQGVGFSSKTLDAVMNGTPMTTKTGGTGLGVISSRTILARAGGELKITSSSSGTVVRLVLPRVPPPKWFFNIANSSATELIVLDDDETIHEKVRRLFPDRKVYATVREAEFLSLVQTKPTAILLVDFDLGGTRTGLDLIKAESVHGRSVLVSGRVSFDSDLRHAAIEHKVRMYPKECLG